jgi:hypothetical protein
MEVTKFIMGMGHLESEDYDLVLAAAVASLVDYKGSKSG